MNVRARIVAGGSIAAALLVALTLGAGAVAADAPAAGTPTAGGSATPSTGAPPGKPASEAPAAAAQAQALLHDYKCYLCHADDATKAGPAYVDVASAYRGDPGAVGRIARVIRTGQRGGGLWHMPPHPEVSPAVAERMARYILSLQE